MLLEGEAGIGKTRLASEFLAWAEIEGADVLQGQAFETGGHLPYRPVIEALRPRIERENAPDDLLSDCGWQNSHACSLNCATAILTYLPRSETSLWHAIACSKHWLA